MEKLILNGGHRGLMAGICMGVMFGMHATAIADEEVFMADTNNPALTDLAQPLQINPDDYGCGPLMEPGTTYYVARQGDDQADGLSWSNAWRTIGRGVAALQAGDTLLLGEGEYHEAPIEMNVRKPQTGEPGRPIRIMAAPGHRVIMHGAPLVREFAAVPDAPGIYAADLPCTAFTTVWEADTGIELQAVPDMEFMRELPGTCMHDREAGRLYVRFADSRGPDIHRGVHVMPSTDAAKRYMVSGAYIEGAWGMGQPRDFRSAFRINASHVLLQGIWFKHYCEAVVVGANVNFRDGTPVNTNLPMGGAHNTVADCRFYSNENVGIMVQARAAWNLIRNNFSARSGYSSGILSYATAHDNLFIGNQLEYSPPMVRVGGGRNRSAINHYGQGVGPRNHVINNLLLDYPLGVMLKPVSPGAVFQGNIIPYGLNCTGTRHLTADDRLVLRNNVIGNTLTWLGENSGPGGARGDWVSAGKAYLNNFFASNFTDDQFNAARFADPAYHDYRLQSDSPLRGAGVGGFDRGAFPAPAAGRIFRVFYVTPQGDDAAPGTARALAFATLQHAARELQAGDTLYIEGADYAETLAVATSGIAEAPIRIRAYGKQPVRLAGMTITGAHVELEGLSVMGAADAGITVSAPEVTLRNCIVAGCGGAGVLARGAPRLQVLNCTLADNAVGLELSNKSTNAIVRDSIIAGNRRAAVAMADDSRAGYHAGQNCYYGADVAGDMVAGEMGSVMGDPLFVDQAARDYRLRWDSPAARLAEVSAPAGGAPVQTRAPAVANPRVENIRPQSAAIFWSTPDDDTRGGVWYRARGASVWNNAIHPEQGTAHGVGLTGLKPGADYEYEIRVTGRWGGETVIPGAFTTPTNETPARTYYLAPDGDDTAAGLTPATAWRSLRKACFAAAPGDTVLVAPGRYRHAIVPLSSGRPDQRITFRRHGAGEVIVDAGFFLAPLVNLGDRGYITLDGFKFVNLPVDGRAGVISLADSTGIEIRNCSTDRVPRDAGSIVSATNSRQLLLEHNVFWGGAISLRFYSGCGDVTVRNNTIAVCNFFHVTIYGAVNGINFVNNIWYLPCSPPKNNGNYTLRGAAVKGFASDYNLFYSPFTNHVRIGRFEHDNNVTKMIGNDLADWREKTGLDMHSLRADPLFMDANTGDFRLRPDSPAIGAGQDGANIGALPPARNVEE